MWEQDHHLSDGTFSVSINWGIPGRRQEHLWVCPEQSDSDHNQPIRWHITSLHNLRDAEVEEDTEAPVDLSTA